MWKRNELRRQGRLAFRRNYWHCIPVCLIILVLCNGLSNPMSTGDASLSLEDLQSSSSAQVVNQISRSMFHADLPLWEEFSQVDQSTNGLLATLFNSSSAAGSVLFGSLNAINQFGFQGNVSAGVILIIGVLLILAYWLFVSNVLRVGAARFFLENRCYPGSHLSRLLMVYRTRTILHVTFTMFMRWLFTALWSLTVIGGLIKAYSYRMVPYILAENAQIHWREAINLSRSMMSGHKWRAFLLDLSFLGWQILDLFTFGILAVLYVNPYKAATNAELYMTLREKELAARPETVQYFRDALLTPVETVPGSQYPAEDYFIPEHKGRQWLAADYRRRYSVIDIVLLFFTFCFIGYVYEVIYVLISSGELVNRGTLYGPWLPIYGTGGIAILVILRPLIEKPIPLFFSAMALSGAIEYATAWVLETFMHTKWWDYSGFFLNIHGRVCLEGLLAFALLGMLAVYVIAPSLAHLYDKLSPNTRRTVCAGLGAAFLADASFSLFHPNMSSADPIAPPDTIPENQTP